MPDSYAAIRFEIRYKEGGTGTLSENRWQHVIILGRLERGSSLADTGIPTLVYHLLLHVYNSDYSYSFLPSVGPDGPTTGSTTSYISIIYEKITSWT